LHFKGDFVRIDKFLKVSRLLKRRSTGKDACNGEKVAVNGKTVKPSHRISVGDVVEIKFGSGTITFKVVMIKETVKKEEACLMYEIING
jgi:ribosomal 50S subunit-recycling heat shock protein